MNELYWITRLNAIIDCLELIIVIAILAGAFGAAAYFIMRNETYMDEDKKRIDKGFIKALKIYIPTLIIAVLLRIFIPTTNEALVIFGIGGTIDYIQQNDTAKQLPDKVINALDAYLDNINKKNE